MVKQCDCTTKACYANLPHLEHHWDPGHGLRDMWCPGLTETAETVVAKAPPEDSTPHTWEAALDYYWFHVARPLMVDRHRKYGPNNILAHGEMGLLVRADDKRARIMNNSGDHTDESVADAWLDWGNYTGPIRWMLVNGYWTLPMEAHE